MCYILMTLKSLFRLLRKICKQIRIQGRWSLKHIMYIEISNGSPAKVIAYLDLICQESLMY